MQGFELGRVDASAIVSERSRRGVGVTIGARTIVYDNVDIGDHSVIGPNVVLGEPHATYYSDPTYENPRLQIGAHALIRSGSILYAGSMLGEHLECGHHVTIREGSDIAAHCRVGTLSDVQGDCRIDEYTRLHSGVFVAQGSSIGRYVWMFPGVILTNDPHPPSEERLGVTIENYAIVATGAVLLPGVRVGEGALVGARALVRNNVPSMTVALGHPAKNVGDVRLIRARDTGEPMYPWPHHFRRGMPWERMGYEAWVKAVDGSDS